LGGGLQAQVGQPEASFTLPQVHAMAQTGPQVGGGVGGGVAVTQAQTLGELSKVAPLMHATFWTQVQIPPQSAPPALGSQESLGSSAHLPEPGQAMPPKPPQKTFGASATHMA
jgi:hypothetical protein